MNQKESDAQLIVSDRDIHLKHHPATLGCSVIGVSSLIKERLFTYDPGFMSTAACESKITFINGIEGQLLYRGYPIEQLASQLRYTQVAHLLMQGQIPSNEQTQQFESELANRSNLSPALWHFLDQLPQDTHPVGNLAAAMAFSAAENHGRWSANTLKDQQDCMLSVVAQMPTIAAACLRKYQNLPLVKPKKHLGYVENFLYQCFAEPNFDKDLILAMDKILTLHADHEQNASTSTVRMAGSTGTPGFAAMTAGITALWGPAHGGANEACLNMLRDIGDVSNADLYVEKAKDKHDPFRLMGFGHRVYKNYDPRARIMQQICHNVLDKCSDEANKPQFALAKALEKIALSDPYFIEKKLYPNIDFYSGLTLDALGFPSEFFTAIFAVGRTVGWASHWLEMMQDPALRISRPRQWYTGPEARDCPNED